MTETMRPFLEGTEAQFVAQIRSDLEQLQREAGWNAF